MMGEKELCESLMGQRLFGDVTEEHLLTTVARAIPWIALTYRQLTETLAAFIRSGPLPETVSLHLADQLGLELYTIVWPVANALASLPSDNRGSWLWDHFLTVVEKKVADHNRHKYNAARFSSELLHKSTSAIIDGLLKAYHCDTCLAIAIAPLPKERRDFIEEQVRWHIQMREEDAMERQEQRISGGY
jgi:hypothetical protein